ncbi:TlpA family protein disulfide reductase [Streptococcus cameli]
MKKWLLTAIALVFSIVLVGCGMRVDEEAVDKMAGTDAYAFTLYDKAGQEVKLSDFEGKKVYINIWGTWCPPCMAEIPELEKVYQSVKDQEDLIFLSVTLPNDKDFKNTTRDKNRKEILEIAQEEGITYPVLFDKKDDMALHYGLQAFPTHIFIDSQGKIDQVLMGSTDAETLKEMLGDLE